MPTNTAVMGSDLKKEKTSGAPGVKPFVRSYNISTGTFQNFFKKKEKETAYGDPCRLPIENLATCIGTGGAEL
jgi:hypothetical protein